MKVVAQIKLLPDSNQAKQLLATMKAFNAAASCAAKVGFDAGVFSPPSVQKLCYRRLREEFGLSSQMAVRAIGKACEVFARDKSVCPVFRPTGAMTYDQRILSWKGLNQVSILTLSGRILTSYIIGEYQRERMDRLKGQVDLVYRDGKFYLYATLDMPENSPIEVTEFVGVDLGIVNLATDSTGESFTGETTERNRKRRTTARKQYQRKGTRNAKRRLKSMSGRQRRFQTWTNHNISKRIVAKAKALVAGIVLEDLKNIRSRIEPTVGRKFRRRLGNWAFAQLRAFVEYKARLVGIPVLKVDPRNTSRTCNACGHCDKANRKSQSEFVCKHCGHSMNADLNAALNLRGLGLGRCKSAPKATA